MNKRVCIILSKKINIKLSVLILGTQVIVARAKRAVENGSDYEDDDKNDDPASDSPGSQRFSASTTTGVMHSNFGQSQQGACCSAVEDVHTCTEAEAETSAPRRRRLYL